MKRLLWLMASVILLQAAERQVSLRMNGPLTHPQSGLAVWVFQRVDMPEDSVALPGPIITARVGDELHLEIFNNLGQAQSLYFYGLNESNGYDGFLLPGENPELLPGTSAQFDFSLSRPGLYPYFSAAQGPLGLQLGLFGAILVQDSAGSGPAPRWWLVYEQDPRWHAGGWTTPELNRYEPEFFGLNNRIVSPAEDTLGTEVIFQAESYRYWIANLGFWRHHYQFNDLQVQIQQRNGHPWQTPLTTGELWLYPGERAQVSLQASGPAPWVEVSFLDPLAADSVQFSVYFQVLPGAGPSGDVNLDGAVTVQDLVILVRSVLGRETLGPQQRLMGDLNEDSLINVQDIVLLVQRIIGNF